MLFTTFQLTAFAQLIVKPIGKYGSDSRASTNARSNQIQVVKDTIQLPFWDDFSRSIVDADTTFWQISEDVLINSTLGINPPTLNVATFDGINSIGQPHNIQEEIVGPTDSLISQPIDLSLVIPEKRNSVLLSFFWQMQGFGEQPDEDDSLRLQLLNSDTVWVSKWMQIGGEENVSDSFQKVYIEITEEEKFFHKGFQMKFQAFGKTTGAFDTWHIDYIYLNQDRTMDDESIFDHSISTQPLSIFSTYTAIPYDQLFAFPDTIMSPLTFDVATQDNTVAQGVLVFYTVKDIIADKVLIEDLTQNTIIPLNIPPENKKRDEMITQVNLSQADFNTETDSLEIEIELSYQSDDSYIIESIDGNDTTFHIDESYNYRVNDTIRRTYIIHETLAYDDGVAEFSAGLNQKNGQLVMEYVIAERDTITHVDLYFPRIKPAASGEIIELLIMSKLDDDLNSILAKQPTTVMHNDSINHFVRYKFETPIIVSDTFYIGFEQNTNEFVGVGLDKNNPQGSRIYFKTQDTWERNSKVEGSLMMRPIFGKTEEAQIVTSLTGGLESIVIYPNPADNFVQIKGTYDHAKLYTISGVEVTILVENGSFSTASLGNGIYILRTSADNMTQSHKLIINH